MRKYNKNLSSTLCDNIYAIYFLYYRNKIVYIGQSLNLKNRLKSHKEGKRSSSQPKKIFTKFSFIPLNIYWDNEIVNNIEAYHIIKNKPKYNIMIPKNVFTNCVFLKDLK